MSIICSEFPFIFPDFDRDLDSHDLNYAYGEKGLSYSSLSDAKIALEKMGFTPTKYVGIWKKGKKKAYITKLRDATMERTGSYFHKTLKRQIETFKTGGYFYNGALITFSGNEPYIKV